MSKVERFINLYTTSSGVTKLVLFILCHAIDMTPIVTTILLIRLWVLQDKPKRKRAICTMARATSPPHTTLKQ